MQHTYPAKVLLEWLHYGFGHHRDTVLPALAVAHDDLPVGEVDILHPQPQALDLAQPRPVQQARHQPLDALQLIEQLPHLRLREHRRQPHRPLRTREPEPRKIPAQHVLVQKEQRRQRLVLRSCRDIALRRQPRKKRVHLRRAHLGRMPPAGKMDKEAHPIPVRFRRAAAVMLHPHRLPKALDQPLPTRPRVRIAFRISLFAHFLRPITPTANPFT
jgi:hypothetical protein